MGGVEGAVGGVTGVLEVRGERLVVRRCCREGPEWSSRCVVESGSAQAAGAVIERWPDLQIDNDGARVWRRCRADGRGMNTLEWVVSVHQAAAMS
jgi:hypothetical protein